MRNRLLKLAVHPLPLDVVSGGFVMAHGPADACSPGEKLLCCLNTWDGCNFPEHCGCSCVNTECPGPGPISLLPLFRGQQKLRPKRVTTS